MPESKLCNNLNSCNLTYQFGMRSSSFMKDESQIFVNRHMLQIFETTIIKPMSEFHSFQNIVLHLFKLFFIVVLLAHLDILH